MSGIQHITDDTFEAEVMKSDKLTIVDFWADWCGPCHMIAPILDELATEFGEQIKVTKMDVDANPTVPGSYKITSIPTIYFFKDGEIVDKAVGALPKSQFIDKIKTYL